MEVGRLELLESAGSGNSSDEARTVTEPTDDTPSKVSSRVSFLLEKAEQNCCSFWNEYLRSAASCVFDGKRRQREKCHLEMETSFTVLKL